MAADVSQNTYPPYNIEKTGENAYRITLAVAGFAEDELTIEVADGQLVVTGRKAETEEKANVLHRGIATRAFERRFQLADHVRAVEAVTENGLLHIDLVREVPEALKPRKIEIAAARRSRRARGRRGLTGRFHPTIERPASRRAVFMSPARRLCRRCSARSSGRGARRRRS